MNTYSVDILIACAHEEDALHLIEALQNVLPSCKITHTPDGIAAIRYIKTNVTPDLVFLDLNMPFKNGIHCLKDIYNHNLLPDTPVIIYSTSKNLKDIKEAYELGAAFYIVKPDSPKELNKLVKNMIFLLGKPKGERVIKSSFVLREATTSYDYNVN